MRRYGFRIVTASLAAISFASFFTGCPAPQSGIVLTDPPVLALSADNRTIAWAQSVPGGRAALSVNGRLDASTYDLINPIVISPDATRIAHGAGTSGVWRMMADGRQIGPDAEAVNTAGAAWSRDNRRLGYGARIKGRWYAVIDGELLPRGGLDSVGVIAFSPDGKRYAFVAGKGEKRAMAADGRVGPFYDTVGDPVWSPDGKRLAYAAASGAKKFIVIDGIAQPAWDETGNPVFSFDGRHCAYGARNGKTGRVIEDGARVGSEYPMETVIDPVVFAPADSRIAFGAYDGKRWFMVIDGKQGPGFKDILSSNILLSPDGRGYAYPAATDDGWVLVRDGRPGQAWDRIVLSDAAYSRDGARFVYAGRKGRDWRLIVDGTEGPTLDYNEISAEGGPDFSPDGRHLALKARRHDKWYVVIDGRDGPAYDRIYKPVFADKGVAYLAERNDIASIVDCLQPYPDADASVKPAEKRLAGIPAYPMTEAECAPCKEKARKLMEKLNTDDE